MGERASRNASSGGTGRSSSADHDRPPVVTLTMNPSVDWSTTTDRVLPGRKLRCAAPNDEPGGGGVNVARVVRRLGGEVSAVYPSGGPAGDRLTELLAGEDVATRPVPIAGSTRTNVAVSEEASGEQFRFVMTGPRLRESEWKRCLEAVAAADARWVVASGSLPRGVPADLYAMLARSVDERRTRVVVDASGAALRHAAAADVFLLKPNHREATSLYEATAAEDAARRAVADGVGAVALSLGAAGAFVVSDEDPDGRHVRPPTVPIRSTVGAGDSMVGGIVCALQRGETLIDAVRFGVAAGAAAVTTPGSELCRREDVERLLADVRVEDQRGG